VRLQNTFEGMGYQCGKCQCVPRSRVPQTLLDKRTDALLKLEAAWVNYVGNPSTVEAYDPSDYAAAPLIDVDSIWT